ncbi:HAD family hydrolase [Phytohabitans suffuscus]|uniref:Hydrolase n=1 Tax=Phytohabitans suffuscus TaxID=624315 RepID=A0A6F8YZB3_9ACTN|nr:HAD-IA family hydrolase [Phytohabitans suffuscus]BCB91404.1 hydrolase [Phytohabitans suffuscus]
MPDQTALPDSRPTRSPLDAVLFDFHGTLAQVEDPVGWVVAAAEECGVTLDRGRATVLADRLVTAGRAGGPVPSRVPPHLAEAFADRDLYEHAHRMAYTGLAATVGAGVDGLEEALYERLLRPEGWVLYADTAGTLMALKEAGVPVAVVSNIGFDIRPHFEAWGFTGLVDAFVLSYEVGRIKPDPAIFLRACGALGVEPERALMVGDTPADAGAVRAGLAALVLPAAEPGKSNGLAAVLNLTAP